VHQIYEEGGANFLFMIWLDGKSRVGCC
jgi:hypothetical protein